MVTWSPGHLVKKADQGRRAEAYQLLTAIYGWFTEGFDTAELVDAKALPSELAEPDGHP